MWNGSVGAAQDADLARPRRVEPAAATLLTGLDPLVFGDDPLDLQQQLTLGALIEVVIEEDDLDALAAQLVDHDHLIRVIPCQSVGTLDVDPVDRPGGGRVAQPFQGGAPEGLARITVVGELEFLGDGQAIGLDPPRNRSS